MSVPRLPMQRVVLAACGSVSAAAAPQTVLVLRKALHLEVQVLLTRSACSFVAPRTLAAVSGREVLTDEALAAVPGSPHLEAGRWADLVLVMPASANVLAKVAGGIADDVTSTCILASAAPVVFAPAMNEVMWHRPAVQRNVAQLRADGYGIVPPVPVPALHVGSEGWGPPPLGVVLDQSVEHLGRMRRGAGACTASSDPEHATQSI